MARTVNSAFDTFLTEKVKLIPDKVVKARSSRDWLLTQINGFPNDGTFPKLYGDANLHFGSFARKTKIRPLDDIDLMIGLHAESSTYSELSDKIEVYVKDDSRLKQYCNENSNKLNSKRIINVFLSKLKDIPQYSQAEIKRNQEAATLKLTSYEWNFDIAPCFMAREDVYGKTYYLIPDGKGNWKKTDPRIDRDRLNTINQSHNSYILNIIRIIKYWNKRPTVPSASSYLIENIILDKYSNILEATSQYIDVEIPKVLSYISSAIYNPVSDPKGIQTDLNLLTFDEKLKISQRANLDYNKALEARRHESQGDMESSIKKWKEIFGNEFPNYE
jgi:hypothetical protein